MIVFYTIKPENNDIVKSAELDKQYVESATISYTKDAAELCIVKDSDGSRDSARKRYSGCKQEECGYQLKLIIDFSIGVCLF